MKFNISVSDWALIDYCLKYTIEFKMKETITRKMDKTELDEITKDCAEINILSNKLKNQSSISEIKKDL